MRLTKEKKEEISAEFDRACEEYFRQFIEEFKLDFERKVEYRRLEPYPNRYFRHEFKKSISENSRPRQFRKLCV